MKNLVDSRIRALKGKSFAELLQLPAYQDERLKHGRTTLTLATWKEASNEHEVKVIVQGYRYLFLGVGRMEARGFVMDRGGSARDLSKEEIYEFT